MSDQPANGGHRRTPGQQILESWDLCERLAVLEGTAEQKAEVAEAIDVVSLLYCLYDEWNRLSALAERTDWAVELHDELAAAEDELWSQELFIAQRLAGRI